MGIFLAVATGGAIGAVLRFVVVSWVAVKLDLSFPMGTLVVNVIGALLIGILAIAIQTRFAGVEWIRYVLIVGVLGGFTTFSAFSLETYSMLENGEYAKSLFNIFSNVVACILATTFGVWISRHIFH